MSDYIQIKSISIDMSTEESPDNRIFAKPIEKQGNVLLCEFESANYDIEQKTLKEENTKLKAENKQLCKKIDELYENIDMWAAENAKFRELLEEVLRHDLSLKEVTALTRKIAEILGEE